MEGRKDRTFGRRTDDTTHMRRTAGDGRRDGRTRMLFKEMERGRRSMIDDDSLNYSGSRKRTGERWTDGAVGRERDQGLRERESRYSRLGIEAEAVAAAPKTAVLLITSRSAHGDSGHNQESIKQIDLALHVWKDISISRGDTSSLPSSVYVSSVVRERVELKSLPSFPRSFVGRRRACRPLPRES